MSATTSSLGPFSLLKSADLEQSDEKQIGLWWLGASICSSAVPFVKEILGTSVGFAADQSARERRCAVSAQSPETGRSFWVVE